MYIHSFIFSYKYLFVRPGRSMAVRKAVKQDGFMRLFKQTLKRRGAPQRNASSARNADACGTRAPL